MKDEKMTEKELAALDKRIDELEKEKLEVKKRIEALMDDMANETRIDSLKERKYEVGTAPNDLPID